MPLAAIASALPMVAKGHEAEPLPVLSLPAGSTKSSVVGAGQPQIEPVHTCAGLAVCALVHELAGFAPGFVPVQSLALQQLPPTVHW